MELLKPYGGKPEHVAQWRKGEQQSVHLSWLVSPKQLSVCSIFDVRSKHLSSIKDGTVDSNSTHTDNIKDKYFIQKFLI